MLSKEESTLLSLTVREKKIIGALEKLKSASMQELAQALKVPRTSLYWPLSQLEGRNIVGHELQGKRKRYFARTAELSLRKKLGSLESTLGDIRVVEGLEHIRELYDASINIHAGERVIIVEGSQAVYTIAQKGGIDFMLAWHRRAHARHIVVETVVGERIFKDLEELRVNPRVIKSLAQLHLWIGYVVPDEWMNLDVALVLFRDVAFITDWDTERAIVINNQGVVQLLRNFSFAFQAVGRKVDIAAHVRGIAGKIK